jgi:hypothetical protein
VDGGEKSTAATAPTIGPVWSWRAVKDVFGDVGGNVDTKRGQGGLESTPQVAVPAR